MFGIMFYCLMLQILVLQGSFELIDPVSYSYQLPQKSGISAYYETVGAHSTFLSTTIENSTFDARGACLKEFRNYSLDHYFDTGFIAIKNQGMRVRSFEQATLKSPKEGALFCRTDFFGIIDAQKREAFVFNEQGEKKVDFSALVPWETAKGGIEVFHSRNGAGFGLQNDNGADYLCVNFYQDSYEFDRYHFKPRVQVIYKLNMIDEVPIIKPNGPIYFIEESLSWKKWLCWKLMHLMKRIDVTVDTTYFDPDRDVSESRQAFLIKGFLLNIPVYLCCYFLSRCLLYRSLDQLAFLGISVLFSYLYFNVIHEVYKVHLLPADGIAVFE